VLSGLEHNNGNALGDGPGDHARAGAVFLTGVHCRKTAGADIKNGVSVDQIAARQVGAQTRLGSIELGCEDTRVVGNCDSGYSCAYTNSLSWRSETTPQPPETNPRAVFERLFGADAGLDPATRAQRMRTRRSILDMVGERSAALRNDLGANDRRKLDEYFTAVREIEQRIAQAESHNSEWQPEMEKPSGIPETFEQHVSLFSVENLTRLLTSEGFEIVDRRTFGRRYRFSYIEQRLKDLSHQSAVLRVLHALALPLRLAPSWYVPINLGDVAGIAARLRSARS